MQQNKVIKKLGEIERYSSNSDILWNTFTSVIKDFRLTSVNGILNRAKTKGIEGADVFGKLFVLVFVEIENVRQLTRSGFGSALTFGRDVYYGFLNNERIDWRKILTSFAKQFCRIVKKKGEAPDNSSPKCLIVDDTLLAKSGKKMEFIGKVFDHCTGGYKLGMKVLTLGFWDGKSFIPLDFTVHNEPGKKQDRGLKKRVLEDQFAKQRHADTPGAARVAEIAHDKISSAITMIRRAIVNSFQPQYVLADSWFITEGFINTVDKIKLKYAKKLFVIGLLKTNRIITLERKTYKASSIPNIKRKEIRHCKKLNCEYIAQKIEYKGIKMQAFWVKMKGQENWKLLISTDTSIRFITTMKYYQIRWTIEVFFKECKQNLAINKCQSTDFDAHIATITMSLISYIILALRKRFDDYESLGELFRAFKDQLLQQNLVQKIWEFTLSLFAEIFAELHIDLERFMEIIIHKQEIIEKLTMHRFQFLFHDPQQVA